MAECEAGACIQVADYGTAVRLHSTQTGTTMQASPEEWLRFVAEVRAGVYDHIEKGWQDKTEEGSLSEPQVQILTWDYREQPDLDELARVVHEVSGCHVHLYLIDTHSDDYALVIAREPIGEVVAHRAFFADYYGGEDQIPPEAKAFLDAYGVGSREVTDVA